MKLQRIAIKNYKSISPAGIEIEFRSGVVVLVGKNNAGKSNILEAVGLLFGNKNPRYVPIPPERFNDPTQPIVIEAEVSDLTWGDGRKVGLSDRQCGSLTHVGKRVETAPGRVTLRLTVPQVEEDNGEDSEGDDQEGDSEAKREFEVFLANRHEMKRNEDFRKALVKHIVVPSVRDHSDLLAPSTWTAFGHMLRSILADSDKLGDLRQLISDATAHLQSILKAEADTLTESARTTAFVDSIDFQLTKDGNPLDLLRNLSLAVSYGSRTEDISQSGTGTQSAVIIGVLELCLRHRSRTGIRLFAVEEPELFLHPHAQRYVADLLRKLGHDPSSQVILTTHSSSILTKTDMLDVIRVDRDKLGATRCVRIDSTPTELATWERYLDADTCEIFFADRVILVEGPSEAILFPRIARHVTGGDGRTCELDRHNISIVQVGGKEKFHVYAGLLDQLGVEWRIVADRDAVAGETLSTFKRTARISPTDEFADQCRGLATAGIAVLSKGEIEDYYPETVIGEIAGCPADDVAQQILQRRLEFEEPTTRQLVETVIREHLDEIVKTKEERLHKVVSRWYDQSLQSLRDGGAVGQVERKTGDILCRWLKTSKPELAQKVAQWIDADPSRLPNVVKRLSLWLVEGVRNNPSEVNGKQVKTRTK